MIPLMQRICGIIVVFFGCRASGEKNDLNPI